MSLFTFKCSNCGQEVTKINGFKDIFSIKTGKKIVCKNCQSEYEVSKLISRIGYFYTLFMSVLFPFVWLALTVLIDKIVSIYNFHLGIEVWFFAAILYIFLEVIVALILPLRKYKNQK